MNRTTIERTSTNEDETRSVLRRRSLIAGVGVLAAGLLATKSAETVRASDGPLQLGGPNTPTAETAISASLNAQNPLLHLSAGGAGNGIESYGNGGGIGVLGYGVNNDGVNGNTNIADGTHAGVHGFAAPGGNGVLGECNFNPNSYGVYGKTDIGVAVRGQSSAGGTGVYGTSTSGYGVQGISTQSHGVYAEAGANQGAGALVGVARTAGTVAFQALAVSPAQYAGYFTGNVSITGSLGVSGGKFAVVKGQDGQYRGMYAVESPECWFEDFGTGTLVNGKADVKLDPLFAQHIHTDSYHVFLTPHDADHHLAATTRAGQAFTVAASASSAATAKGKQATDLNGTFSYRIVAKRNDIKGDRLPIWEMPTTPHIPDPPVPTKKP